MACRGLRIAVQGCCHGELDRIYDAMKIIEERDGKPIDLLICCGDFQAIRNMDDLECMACPNKYRELGTFWQYYSGVKEAPYPTLFVGGNHEASNYLWELYYGGWVAPKIWFLGYAGVINFGGIRIGGLSGIYKQSHYKMGHFERPPYTDETLRSVYNVRELEVHRLLQLQGPLDVFLSHDWPLGIARHGDVERLLRHNPFLRTEVENNTLGSPPAATLLSALKPHYWFSAHLHTEFAALVDHGPDAPPTRFLALDKCLRKQQFLQVVDFPEAEGPKEFSYDAEWLAVLRGTHSMLSLQALPRKKPDMRRAGPLKQDVQFVKEALQRRGGSQVPDNFQPTATSAAAQSDEEKRGRMPQQCLRNPQTVQLLELIGRPWNLD